MSEGMSAFFRSNQPPEQRAMKRSRAQDVDSGGSTGGFRCRYHRCEKLTREGREFCGETHRNFFVANLADMLDKEGATGSSHGNGMCMLPGCDLPVRLDSTTGYKDDFCALDHLHEYLKICIRQWYKKGRLCKLEGCTNHVWVEETTKRLHEFCRTKCAKRFFARRELSSLDNCPATLDPSKVDEEGPNGDEVSKERSSQEASEQDVHEKLHKKCGYHAKKADLTESTTKCLTHIVRHLKDPSGKLCSETDISKYLLPRDLANADPKVNFCKDIDISRKHPWELNDSKGNEALYILLMYDSEESEEGTTKKTKGTTRTTKESFVWRQSSSPGKRVGNKKTPYLKKRYLGYSYNGENDSSNDHHGGHVIAYRMQTGSKKTRWMMHEYFLSDDAIKELTCGSLPRFRPKICKIFENKDGRPVWPPARQDNEGTPAITKDANAVVPAGTSPNMALPCTGAVSSTVFSNVLPHSHLSFSTEFSMGSNSKESGEFCLSTVLEDPMLHQFPLMDFLPLGTTEQFPLFDFPPLDTTEQLFEIM